VGAGVYEKLSYLLGLVVVEFPEDNAEPDPRAEVPAPDDPTVDVKSDSRTGQPALKHNGRVKIQTELPEGPSVGDDAIDTALAEIDQMGGDGLAITADLRTSLDRNPGIAPALGRHGGRTAVAP